MVCYFQQIVEELTSKINECLQRGLPEGGSTKFDSATAESQDSDDEERKPSLSARTPGRRLKIEPRTPGGKFPSESFFWKPRIAFVYISLLYRPRPRKRERERI